MPSVLEIDRLNVQHYLARKWGLPIGQNLGVVANNWVSQGKFGNSQVSFNKTDGKAVQLAGGMSKDTKVASLSFWINPESSYFHLFSLDGIAPEL